MSLLPGDRSKLEEIVSRGDNWRCRKRADTLLLLDDGVLAIDVAARLGIHYRTVCTTRRDWFRSGLTSLPDLPRSGAPKKITPAQLDKIIAAAVAEPLTATELLSMHIKGGGLPLKVGTLTTALKACGMVWKRTRHSLKKRNEAAFRAAEIEIEQLRRRAADGEISLAYVDEVGFSQVHPNRNAWTPIGSRHLIEAKRGKRLNVLAAMISSGEIFSAKLWRTTTSDAFSGFLSLLHEHVGKPLTVILDNASIHKAKSEQHIIKHLESQGLTLCFLPPYSPELNRIERLWHKMNTLGWPRNAATARNSKPTSTTYFLTSGPSSSSLFDANNLTR